MKGRPAKKGFEYEHRTYEATLEEVNCYTSENMNTKELEVGLTFVWNLNEEHPEKPDEDLMFFDGFITVPQDDEGYPLLSGKRSKLYSRLYGLFGRDFDPTAEDVDYEFGFPKRYDSPEALLDMPMWNSYGKDDARLKLRFIKLFGIDLIGKSAIIELGNADKPGGGKSDRTSVISCKPVPKRNKRRNQEETDDEDEAPVRQSSAGPQRPAPRKNEENDVPEEALPV
jgi:hypothetical protein